MNSCIRRATSNSRSILRSLISSSSSSSSSKIVSCSSGIETNFWIIRCRGLFFRASRADEEKEAALKYRRVVFGRQDWIDHRSSRRHIDHILSIPSSRVIRSLGPPIATLTLLSAAICACNAASLPFHVDELPFQLSAPALALLLVFRTNSSYGRYDEGRKAFGANTIRARDLARQVLCFIRHADDRHHKEQLLAYIMAFPYCLKHQLQSSEDDNKTLRDEIKHVVPADDLARLLAAAHRPNYILQLMSHTIMRCKHLHPGDRFLMDQNVMQFHDNIGSCERIFKTPIPLSYTHLTSRMLILWHVSLPLALWESCQWLTVPATAFSATALLCIDEVGVIIEEPFSILPLGSICANIEKNVKELIKCHEDAEADG